MKHVLENRTSKTQKTDFITYFKVYEQTKKNIFNLNYLNIIIANSDKVICAPKMINLQFFIVV